MLELDSGASLPLVEACVRRWISPAGESLSPWGSQTRIAAVRIDVFTLVPHAYAWLTEQRPVAGVLGGELELRLFNYRDSTPLRAGQVDDEPYGGGAGMVLRVDVVAAALEAVYGGEPPGPVIALTPKGRQLTQPVVEELAALPAFTLLSSRYEGFDERIVEHLCDRRDLGRAVRPLERRPAGDDRPRRGRAAAARRARRGIGRARELLRGARRRARVPALHATGRVPRLAGADVLLSGDHARVDAWRREQVR